MSVSAEKVVTLPSKSDRSASATVLAHAANELVFAVVGHIGSGTTAIADKLVSLLGDRSAIGDIYDVSYIKATDLISAWARAHGKAVPELRPGEAKTISYVTQFQDLGDAMRKETKDFAAVAKAFAIRIRQVRSEKLKVKLEPGAAVRPDGTRRAYVLDSIRHPSEVQLLRHIYQDAFVLVGVVCESDTREDRVARKYHDATRDQVVQLMKRDEKDPEKHGQRVADAFHLAEFFVDNTPARTRGDGSANPAWDLAERLSRLIKIIRQQDVVRPESAETAMWHAHGAAMKSACLSRQVGAALVDRNGDVVSTGTNEVPRAGGGIYGEGFGGAETADHRCAYRFVDGLPPYCSNTREQNEIINDLLRSIGAIKALNPQESEKISALLRKGRIGDLLEFSRAVHAEMDALLTAGRNGVTTVGTRLFVTTFPCHYCARHIVSAGIDEVQYIEPYPKSHALRLHSDSVQITVDGWTVPSSQRAMDLLPTGSTSQRTADPARVLFRPFTGVAPRLYRRAFLKDGELKNTVTGNREITPPEWGSPWHLRRVGYADLEAELDNPAPE